MHLEVLCFVAAASFSPSAISESRQSHDFLRSCDEKESTAMFANVLLHFKLVIFFNLILA